MPLDPAQLLFAKAADDERLALLVINSTIVRDEQIGFLAQQAIEKGLKAVLSCLAIAYRRTHDLTELLDLLKANNITFPEELESSVALTPFAAEMRYDYLPPELTSEPPFDRAATMRLVRTTLTWAASHLPGDDATI